MEMIVHHQNIMIALRQEMGWPAFTPANDAIAWSSGMPMDAEVGMEVARVAQALGKDIVYGAWKNTKAREMEGLSVVYRQLLTVDIVEGLVPWAANDTAPLLLVSTRRDEMFGIDHRGTLTRMHPKPRAIGAGRKLAEKRIRAAAAQMGDALLPNNRHVPWGDPSITRDVPTETIVRFG